jgi:hypothetical protein
MKDVDYFSSMGIRVLLSTYKTLKAKGGSLKVVEPSEFVFSTLAFVGLDEYIVDKSTVIKADGGSDSDYGEVLSDEISFAFTEFMNGSTDSVYDWMTAFFDKINLGRNIRNGLDLFFEEVRLMIAYNRQDGYGAGVESTVKLDYTPSPKALTLSIFMKNHDIAQFAKNLKRLNTKSFDIDASSVEYGEELAKRAAFAFFDKSEANTANDGVNFVFVKNLK